jgi:hypothetical protein
MAGHLADVGRAPGGSSVPVPSRILASSAPRGVKVTLGAFGAAGFEAAAADG